MLPPSREGCSIAQLWLAATGQPLASLIKYGSSVNSVAISPDGKTIISATKWWIHQCIITGDTIKPKASHLLPGSWTGAYRFLDEKGDRMQVAVWVSCNAIKIIELRFDRPIAPPIQGDPRTLLDEWQQKLALKLDEKTGKIEKVVNGEI